MAADDERERRSGPLRAEHIAGSRHLAENADSIFAIGRSTYGDDIRYIKQIKSSASPPAHAETNVLVYRIERLTRPNAECGMQNAESQKSSPPVPGRVEPALVSGSPPVLGGVASASDDGVVPWQTPGPFRLPDEPAEGATLLRTAALDIARDRTSVLSQPTGAPSEPRPFTGFRFLGTSAETDHLRDHTADLARIELCDQVRQLTAAGFLPKMIALVLGRSLPTIRSIISENSLRDPDATLRLAERLEQQQPKKPKTIVETLMSREYKRYLDR